MQELGYYNGVWGDLRKMQVPMLDRGFYFGDGIYDAAFARNGIIYALDTHLQRFFAHAQAIGLQLTYTEQSLRTLLQMLVREVDGDECFVYWQATRGTALRSHVPPQGLVANLAVMITPRRVLAARTTYVLHAVEDVRHHLCQHKSLNLLAAVLAAKQADECGADEALLYRIAPDGRKRITECAHSNVCALTEQGMVFPPADCWILDGVARRHLMQECARQGIPVIEDVLWMEDLLDAREVFTTASGALCARVTRIDDVSVGGKDVQLAHSLQDALYQEYLDATRKQM